MKHLSESQGRPGRSADSSGGTEILSWNRSYYQFQLMVGTNASTNKKHNFTMKCHRPFNKEEEIVSQRLYSCVLVLLTWEPRYKIEKWTEQNIRLPGSEY